MQVLDAEAVARRLPDEAAVHAALREAFLELHRGSAQQPAQTVLALADGASDVIVYPALVDGPKLAGVKLSPYLAARPPGERVTAWTLLLSLDDGLPVLLCDGMQLTVERTAGTTALAVDLLAPADARRLAVVGSGPVALAHLRHVARLRDWERISVTSPALATGDAEKREAVAALPFAVAIDAGAVGDADVVCLCTSAAGPVIALGECAPDALVTSVSTNAPGAHEVAAEELGGCAVYVDARSGAPVSASELRGLHEDAIAGSLPELVAGAAPPRPPGRAFFRSVGLGIEDIAVATLLLEAA